MRSDVGVIVDGTGVGTSLQAGAAAGAASVHAMPVVDRPRSDPL